MSFKRTAHDGDIRDQWRLTLPSLKKIAQQVGYCDSWWPGAESIRAEDACNSN